MEPVYLLTAFAVGVASGYGFRTDLAKELTTLRAEFAMEASVLRADITKIVADVKAKV